MTMNKTTKSYRGKYPDRIRTVMQSAMRGAMIVVTNSGERAMAYAADNDGIIPKCGNEASKYVLREVI